MVSKDKIKNLMQGGDMAVGRHSSYGPVGGKPWRTPRLTEVRVPAATAVAAVTNPDIGITS